MFGSLYFGQTYFGDVPVQTVGDGDCGGMWGSATFGSPYFGQHNQCGDIPTPPNPPEPPITPVRRPGVAGSEQRAQWFYTDDELRNRALLEEMRVDEADTEDIALIMGLWLNRKQ